VPDAPNTGVLIIVGLSGIVVLARCKARHAGVRN
jgi:hypothetical protein